MAGGGRWRSYGSLTAQVANIVPGIGASGVQVLSQVPQPIGEVLVPSRDAISDVPDAFLKFSAVGGYALESGSNVVDESLAVASDDAFAQEIGRNGIQQPQRTKRRICGEPGHYRGCASAKESIKGINRLIENGFSRNNRAEQGGSKQATGRKTGCSQRSASQRAQAKITCQAVSENAAAYGSGCSDDVLQSTCFWCICHINITTI